MNWRYLIWSLAVSICLASIGNADTFGNGDLSFDLDFVSIEPGNRSTGFGQVDYRYRIGKFEVSKRSFDIANQLGKLEIDSGPHQPEGPASGLTWMESARFVNWLNESQGYPHAYKFEFQPGEERNSLAKYVLPTNDEWFRAAFFDPSRDQFWRYASGSESPPLAVRGGTEPGTAVLASPAPAGVMDAGGPNQNGITGMVGNVTEWSETPQGPIPDSFLEAQHRSILGTNYTSPAARPSFNSRGSGLPQNSGNPIMGLRVASVPEPEGAALLFLAAIVAMSLGRKRR